ncbi:MAG: alpha/beta hydrolase-fold protein, partial [Actinomycetota bacterium]|nr:alpha/beta hydrolase-fold protein [Actinomycetota bacterium]
TDVRHLSRPDVGRSYRLWTELPARYDPETEGGYPLVLCLDAVWTFGTVVDLARILGLGREIPRSIVVGLAHDDPDVKQVLQLRAMDFTVTAVEAPAMTGVRVPADQLGGSTAFRAWLADTVLPMLRSEYPVSEVILVGHSFSALFGVDVLFNQPDLFDRYLLASPSVWWDDRVMFDREAEHAQRVDRLDAKVFMSRGSLETDEYSPHREFHDQLAGRNHPGLQLHWHEFEGETHSSTVSVAVNRGLRVLMNQ